ncbi:hypothetical protein [Fluviicola sp.]|uniref:hypothetical protein n=1 Tax=Fluviicola sp. TaxID=1917219 RepID=UPI0031E1E1B2
MNSKRIEMIKILVLTIGLLSGLSAWSQTPTVAVNTTVTHNTCTPSLGSCSYTLVPSNGWLSSTRITSLKLYYDNYVTGVSDFFYDHLALYANTNPSGTVSNIPPGHYYFTGTITTKDGSGNNVNVNFSKHIWVGYQVSWESQSEMISGTTLNSIYRNLTTSGNTYGWEQSFNTSSGYYGFIEFQKKTATTYPNTMYCVFNPPSDLSTFTPAGNYQYIEIRQSTASASSIKLKYYNGTSYVTTTLSSNSTDRVRFFRVNSASTCVIQLNDSPTNVSPNFTQTGLLKVTIFTDQLNTEAQNVITYFPCAARTNSNTSPAEVKRELDGGYVSAVEGKLKFYYQEEYSIEPGKFLPFTIYDEDYVKKASCDFNGTTFPVGNTFMKLPYNYDDNTYNMTLSTLGLTVGKYYILELQNPTGEKRYLRFLYNN